MKQAPLPLNEAARLRSLKLFDILDTAVEARYDDLTALAAKICDVPICLISLIDEERQWFKSHHGLAVRETPRELAFCSHAILGQDIMEISDSRRDERFHDNPLVIEMPHVVFYAGMPLMDTDDNNLGTLCVIGQKPKSLNDEQRDALRVIARQVMTHFELRRALKVTQGLLDSAQHFAQTKSTFMANISHEIRAPLQGISGASELLKNSGVTDRQMRLINILQDSGCILEQLIRDVADLAMIETGRLKIMAEPYDFNLVLQQLAVDHKSRIEERSNRLRLTIDPKLSSILVGDRTRVRQVLDQLLIHANSVTSSGELGLDARIDDKKDGNFVLRLTLADQGRKLSDDILANLFDRFELVEARDAGDLASTGIGLAIAYKLMHLMNGDLTVRTGCSAGSIFTMTMNINAA